MNINRLDIHFIKVVQHNKHLFYEITINDNQVIYRLYNHQITIGSRMIPHFYIYY